MRIARGMSAGICALCLLIGAVGCGSVRETLPSRSAMEQLLLSTAADRAVDALPTEGLRDKTVLLDVSDLECLDKPYVVARIREELVSNGARLAAGREDADVILHVASGGLSINKRDYLLGIPAIPLPLATETVIFPEAPLFKLVSYRSTAKLLFTAIDPKDNSQAFDLPVCYGKASEHFWWLLFTGPYRRSDLPKEAQ